MPGNLYYIDTSSSALSGYLPAGSEDGEIITVVDISGSFGTNSFTIETSGTTINDAGAFVCETDNSAYFLFYESTYGWRLTTGGASGGSATFSLANLKPEDFSFDDESPTLDYGNL